MRLILASSSAIRRAMLAAAGVEFDTLAPQLDEAEIKGKISATDAIAPQLAAAKGLAVSKHEPEAWVIGSDSVVQVEGRHFNKPESRQEAADHLRFFSGKAMRLTSAVALVRAGEIVWQYDDTATLQVRELSESFIEDYLDAEWPEVGYCVGVFRMEARGVQLFDRIDGDHFTILGMPLLPVLGALRERGLVPA